MRLPLLIANVAAPLAVLFSGFSCWALAAMFATHMLSLWATLVPACNWWGPVQTKLESGQSGVWLTIDDGPDGEHTRAAMDLLEARGARACFFFIGERAAAQAELVQEVVDRGHGVGNHTRSHPARSFWRLGPRRLRAEIEGGAKDISAILGREPRLFRAPAGMRNPFVHPILHRLGLELVAWNARGFDGRSTQVEAIVARIGRKLGPGSIVLLHECRRTAEGGPLLLETLPRVLDLLEERGLETTNPTKG